MPRLERDRVLRQVAELQATLGEVKSEDVKETLLEALAERRRLLSELDAQLGIEDE